jgi:hypothetical protein
MNFVLSPTLRQLAVGSLLLTGCQLDIAADLVKNSPGNDGGPSTTCPVGFVCSPVGDPPALDDAGDPSPMVDGGMQVDGGDAGGWPDPSKDAGEGCTEDSECAAGAFCANDGTCHAACDDERGCVVPYTGPVSVRFIAAHEDAIVWSSDSQTDSLGNLLYNGTIWRMDEGGTSTRIASGFSYSWLEAIDGNDVYFKGVSATGTVIRRTSILGAVASEEFGPESGPATEFVASENYLWWTQLAPPPRDWTNSHELWRRPKAGGVDEQVDLIGQWDLIAATDTEVTAMENQGPASNIVRYKIGNVADDILPAGCDDAKSASFYENDVIVGAIGGPVRVNPEGQATRLAPLTVGCSVAVVRAPWVFWIAETTEEGDQVRTMQIGRTHIDLALAPQEIAKVSMPMGTYILPRFALSPWSQELIYHHTSEQRLFRVELPDYPCSNGIACPDGLACQPDLTCQ